MLIRGKPIKGGLCKPGVVPTGTPTCVYNYKDLDFVNLDELAGITAMKCGTAGDRTCKDWADWRKNCYDPDKKYKKKFKCDDCHEQGNWQWNWEETDFCVEYDLNPLCQDTAFCLLQPKLTEDKEVGLPFWQGRCEERENIRRAEKLAAKALGKDLRSQRCFKLVLNFNIDLLENNPTCSRAANCKPNPNGGPYCSRQFGGVCTPCYIPGTQEPFSNPDNTPTCPFSLKEEIGGPAGVAANTKCKSKSASDLCCLYGVDGSCDKDFADGHEGLLSTDGGDGGKARGRNGTTPAASTASRPRRGTGVPNPQPMSIDDAVAMWLDVLGWAGPGDIGRTTSVLPPEGEEDRRNFIRGLDAADLQVMTVAMLQVLGRLFIEMSRLVTQHFTIRGRDVVRVEV
eukprot:s772_g6.t1